MVQPTLCEKGGEGGAFPALGWNASSSRNKRERYSRETDHLLGQKVIAIPTDYEVYVTSLGVLVLSRGRSLGLSLALVIDFLYTGHALGLVRSDALQLTGLDLAGKRYHSRAG